MSTLKTNTIKNTDDVEMYLAKAWVNFNGTGTVAIRAAGNVSSITDAGVGRYTVNFINAMPDANYAFGGMAKDNSGGFTLGQNPAGTFTASACSLQVVKTSPTSEADSDYITAIFVR